MRKTLEILGNLVFGVLMLAVLGASLAPYLLDVTFHTIISASMTPLIHPGDVVALNERTTPEEVRVGHIIAFQVEGVDIPVTHRVIEILEIDERVGFRTQGDALEEPDPWLLGPDQLLGRVIFHVPGLGYAARLVKTNYGFGLLIVLPGLMVVALQVKDLVESGKRPSHREIRPDGSDRTPAYLCLFACLVVIGSLWGLVAGNLQKAPLSSFERVSEPDESQAAFHRTIHNHSPFPLVLCLTSEDSDVTFSKAYFFLPTGKQKSVEMEGGSDDTLITTAGFLPLLPPKLLYQLLVWNAQLAPLLAASIPLLPLALIGFILLGGTAPSRPDRRKRARYMQRLGYM